MGAIMRGGGGGAIGDVKSCALNAVPFGWLKCNGAAVSRTAYAALFAAVGTVYGVGDGSTTFNVPDLRGEFIRGLDESRGVDSGRVIGTAQASQFGSHSHSGVLTWAGGDIYAPFSSGTNAAVGSSSATGGTETRPRNVAMIFCIKF